MVCGSEGEAPKSRIDPWDVCSERVMANSVLCTMCGKWIHSRCVKIKKMTSKMVKDFVCKKCRKSSKEKVKTIKTMWNEVETINVFCYLGD